MDIRRGDVSIGASDLLGEATDADTRHEKCVCAQARLSVIVIFEVLAFPKRRQWPRLASPLFFRVIVGHARYGMNKNPKGMLGDLHSSGT